MGFSSFGLINFLYRIWRSKKFRKFVIGFGFLAFVLFTIFNNTTFAAQSDAEYTTDTTIAILEAYQRNIDIFVKSFDRLYSTNDTYKARMNTIFDNVQNSYYLYLRHYSVTNENLNVLLYTRSGVDINQVSTNWLCDGPNNSYLAIPTTGYNVTFNKNANISVNAFGLNSLSDITLTDFIPSVLLYRMPSEIVERMQVAGYSYTGPIVDIKQAINDMKETMEDINDTLNADPDDDEANTDINNMLVDNTTDVTTEGFNSIFEKIKTNFLNPQNTSATITIPFTNKSFTISRNTIYGGLYNNIRNSAIGTLITSYWWFCLGYFIYKDISNIVNKVKSGEIEGIENTNIKENML